MQWFFIGATSVDVAAISTVIGVLICSIWVIPRQATKVHQRLWLGLAGALVLMTFASALMLVSRTLEFSGAPFDRLTDYLSLVVGQTQYGRIWQVRMAAIGFLWMSWIGGYIWRVQGRHRAAIAGFLAMLVVVFSRSSTGHAGDNGIFTFHVWVDCLHVLSAGVWVGSLFAFSLLISPLLLDVRSTDPVVSTTIYRRLSTLLGFALALLVMTGIYNAVPGLVRVQNLWETPYGLTLTIKVALVMCMVLIGAHNRHVKIPALTRWFSTYEHPLLPIWFERIGGSALVANYPSDQALARLSRAILIESLMALAVILAASILHHSMPPSDFRSMGAPA